jgi:uncharacterized protein (TIGR03083 family)
MEKTEVWSTVHAERKALAADLEGISDDQWSSRTPCSEWTVSDVVAHMSATANLTPATFFPKLMASGFNLGRMQAKNVAVERDSAPADTLAGFRAVETSMKHPPGPAATWLGETIIHAEDIRRALGITHEYPIDAVREVADTYKGSNLVIGAKRRIAGVTLRATDTDWSHGSGPELAGPMLPILLAMTGRKSALDDLTGDGVATLRTRA